MGVIWTSGTRARQPANITQINWANPITTGLKIALLPHVGSGNLAKGNIGSYSSQPGRTISNGLAALDWITGTGDRAFNAGHSNNAITAVSMVALINNPNSGGNLGPLFGNRDGYNGGIVVYGETTGTAPSQQARIQVTHGAVAALSASGYNTVAGAINTRWLPVGFVDVAGSTCRYFLDGKFDSSVASASISQTTFGYQVARDQKDTTNANCNMAVFLWWDRALSDAEMVSVQANPWQVFTPERRPVFYSLPSGSNNTGTLNSTLTNVTLAGVGGVSRTATLATTLDNVTLAGIGNAAVSNITATLATTLSNVTLAGVGGVTRSATLSSTLDAATLAGVGSVAVGANRDGVLATTLAAATLAGIGGVTRSGTLSTTLSNVTLSGIGTIPVATSTKGGAATSKKKQKKRLKVIETEEWLKAEETAKQLLQDRFTKTTPETKLEALSTHIESLQPVIEALKALTEPVQEKETVQETQTEEISEHQQVLNKFDALITKMTSIEELLIIMLAQ